MIDNQHTKDHNNNNNNDDDNRKVNAIPDEIVTDSGVHNDPNLKEKDTTKDFNIEKYDVWFYAMKLMALRSLSLLLQ